MSGSTENLNLFKYDTATDGKQVFSIDNALNDNWDKLDTFAQGIKDLSNLSEIGEKRFSDINTELEKKLEAEVLLAENGYIKFNNGILVQFGKMVPVSSGSQMTLTYPISYTIIPCIFKNYGRNTDGAEFRYMNFYNITITKANTYMHTNTPEVCWFSIGS